MAVIGIIALSIIAVLLIIGIFRVIFDDKRRDGILDILLDMMLLDCLFDVLGAIFSIIGDLFDGL